MSVDGHIEVKTEGVFGRRCMYHFAMREHSGLNANGLARPDAEAAGVPTRRDRLIVAFLVGAAAGALTLWLRLSGRSPFSDFDVMWLAGRALLAGRDPYAAVAAGFHWPLHYPLPAAIVTLPFVALPQVWAAAAWIAFGFGILAYFLTGRGWWALLCLASYPAVDCAQIAQWSPLVTTIAFVPSLAFLSVAKPTTGAAIAIAYANRTLERNVFLRAAGIAFALLVVSFIARPTWPNEWRQSIANAYHFTPIVFRPGGVFLLAALLRWRRPEARLVALFAFMPQSMAPYDAMPLLLTICTRREALTVAWLSYLGLPFLQTRIGTGVEFTTAVEHNAPILLLTVYLPALVLVLRRANEGPAPQWTERFLSRAPACVRGRPVAAAKERTAVDAHVAN